jgi:hypothetical protein
MRSHSPQGPVGGPNCATRRLSAGPRIWRTVLALAVAAVSAACGGSSSNTLTAPSTTTRCAVNLQAVTSSLPSEGGAGAVTVSVNRECSWEAAADVGWITLTPPRAGQGSATLGFTVSSNPQPSTRRGGLIVNDSRVEITQAGAVCTVTIDSAFGTIGPDGGPLRVVVAGASGCPWTAVSQAGWIRVLSGASGDGAGAVTLEIDANPGEPRTGTVAIAGQVYTVAQGSAPAPTPPTPPAPGCSYSVGPATVTVAASGGTVPVNVVAPAGCTWTATSTAGWLTVGPGAGQGAASVTVSAAPNTANAVRTASVVVAGRPVLVVQDAAPPPTPPVVNCSYTVGPATQTLPASGGSTVVNVMSPSSCAWTSTSSVEWLIVLSGGSGSGSGNVMLSAAPNPSSTARTGSVIAAGQTVQIVQEGTVSNPNPSCTHEVSPLTVSVGAAATTTALSVTSSAASCAWTAVSGAPWITVNAPGGNGNGQVAIAVAANEGTTPRSGTVTVAGKTVQVTQAGTTAEPTPTCSFTVVPTTQTLGAAAGSGEVVVTGSAPTCGWTATSGAPWITVVSGAAGTGSGVVAYQVTANEATSPRTGTLTVAGQVVTLTQLAATPPACAYQLQPSSIAISAEGGPATTHLQTAAECTWSAASQVNWITVASAPSGTGSTDVQMTVAANPDTAARTGTVVIGGQSFQVNQAGAPAPPPCTFSVAPTSQAVSADGGPGQVSVTASATTCTWTATSGVPWITVTGGAAGTGNGTVAYQVAANDTTTARTGTLSVAGQVVTVTQPGKEPAPCTYQLTPTSVSVPAAGGDATTLLETAAHCTWTAASQAAWISVVSGTSGTGSATVRVLAPANPTTTARTGTVSIGGQTLQVTQPGEAATVVTFSGTVASSSGTCPNRTFKIMGQEIVTDSGTTYQGGSCNALMNGVKVAGEGVLQQNGTVRATVVQVQP